MDRDRVQGDNLTVGFLHISQSRIDSGQADSRSPRNDLTMASVNTRRCVFIETESLSHKWNCFSAAVTSNLG